MSEEEDKQKSGCGGLFDALRGFSKGSLKSTETKVLTVTGEEFIETKDCEGRIVTKKNENKPRTYGFVGWGIPDMQVGNVLPGLLIGSQDVAQDLETLQANKVTHILNLATYVENAFPSKFKYKTMKIWDTPEADITSLFDSAFKFIDEGRKKEGCVLVHCNAGVSRAATIVIAYVMSREGMTLQHAYSHVKDKRPAIRPNDGFQMQLKAYDEILKKNRH